MILIASLIACRTEPPQGPPPPPTAHAELDGMDARKPVPLLPRMALHQKEQMRDHLVVVQEVVAALAAEDWPAVEAAAARMGSSPEMAGTCEHMGAAADGFTEQALDFHRRVDAIPIAARAHDAKAVLLATAEALEACTACHATWRQQVLPPEAFERLGTGATGVH